MGMADWAETCELGTGRSWRGALGMDEHQDVRGLDLNNDAGLVCIYLLAAFTGMPISCH